MDITEKFSRLLFDEVVSPWPKRFIPATFGTVTIESYSNERCLLIRQVWQALPHELLDKENALYITAYVDFYDEVSRIFDTFNNCQPLRKTFTNFMRYHGIPLRLIRNAGNENFVGWFLNHCVVKWAPFESINSYRFSRGMTLLKKDGARTMAYLYFSLDPNQF